MRRLYLWKWGFSNQQARFQLSPHSHAPPQISGESRRPRLCRRHHLLLNWTISMQIWFLFYRYQFRVGSIEKSWSREDRKKKDGGEKEDGKKRGSSLQLVVSTHRPMRALINVCLLEKLRPSPSTPTRPIAHVTPEHFFTLLFKSGTDFLEWDRRNVFYPYLHPLCSIN